MADARSKLKSEILCRSCHEADSISTQSGMVCKYQQSFEALSVFISFDRCSSVFLLSPFRFSLR